MIKYLTLLLTLLLSHYAIADDCAKSQVTCVVVNVNNIDGNALEDVIVYLEPLSGQKLPSSSKTVVIDQKNKSFSPYVSVSQTHHNVHFSNRDDITHHIYSANNENKFSFKVRAGKTNDSLTFDQSAEIAMGCNIHDWMSGYLLVVDTPYFAKTNVSGQASFAIEQHGQYRITVWHPQITDTTNRVTIDKNITSDQTFTLALTQKMADIPIQENAEDFDFLSEYE